MFISLMPVGRSNAGITFYELKVLTEARRCVRAFQLLMQDADTVDSVVAALEQLRIELAVRPTPR